MAKNRPKHRPNEAEKQNRYRRAMQVKKYLQIYRKLRPKRSKTRGEKFESCCYATRRDQPFKS